MSNTNDIWQVVLDPEDAQDEELVEAALAATLRHNVTLPNRLLLKMLAMRLLHPFGKHTWVSWRAYDRSSDRIIDTGREVCEWCPRGR